MFRGKYEDTEFKKLLLFCKRSFTETTHFIEVIDTNLLTNVYNFSLASLPKIDYYVFRVKLLPKHFDKGGQVHMLKITLQAARVNAGLTQMQVAEQFGVVNKTISNWESGKTEIKPFQLMSLCQLYGVSVDNIILPKKFTQSELN